MQRLAHFTLDSRTICHRALSSAMEITVILIFEAKRKRIRTKVDLCHLRIYLIIIHLITTMF